MAISSSIRVVGCVAIIGLLQTAGISFGQTLKVFKWNKNNDWSNKDNWVGSNIPNGVVDLSSGCVDKFGPLGGNIRLDASASAATLILPEDGSLELDDGMVLTITGDDEVEGGVQDGDWRCKSDLEMNTACSDNYLQKVNDEYVPADTAPCFNDVLQIEENAATQVIWNSGQYLRSVELVDVNNISQSLLKSTSELEAYDNVHQDTFQGLVPKISEVSACGGPTLCELQCIDMCPKVDVATVDRDEFFNLDVQERDDLIRDIETDRNNLNEFRFSATTDFTKGASKLKRTTTEVQKDYETQMEQDGYELQSGRGDVTVPVMLVTAAQMANWMEVSQVGEAHERHYVRHSLTQGNAKKTVSFFEKVVAGESYYGTEEQPDEEPKYEPMRLDQKLWENIDAKGPTGGGWQGRLSRRQVYNSLVQFVLSDANKNLQAYTSAQDLRIVDFTGPEGAPADPALDFDNAAGGFKLSNVILRNAQSFFNPNTGDTKPADAPMVVQMALASSLTRMAMFVRAESLRLTLHYRPTTTWSPTTSPTASPTVSPTQSPSVSPTLSPSTSPTLSPTLSPTAPAQDALMGNIIPIAAGGAGALVLIILVIIIIVLLMRGGDRDGKKDDDKRNVVAFENPMYDDPAMTSNAASNEQYDNSDLYDEPTFTEDKSNPMYASQEQDIENDPNNPDGYLDVQPDDNDSEEDYEDSDDGSDDESDDE